MHKKIIFINQETGPLLIDIINVFAKENFNIILYTGKVIETYAKLDKNIKIKKFVTYKKQNNLIRLFTWSIFFLQTLIQLIKDSKKNVKIYYSSNPPIIYYLNLIFKSKSFIHVYDVYPNALLSHPKISQKSFIYKFLEFLNKKSFKNAQILLTPSHGMKIMLGDYCKSNKIKAISWWADTDFISPIEKSKNKFIKKYNLENQFIVMYSGNLGATHNIEKLLNLSTSLINYESIKIIIIGNGSKKNLVDRFKEKNQLSNLLVLPFQDIDMLPYSLTAPDISIVLDNLSNDDSVSTASIPSKLFYIMAAGTAVYAESDKKSELNRIINKYNIGLCDDLKNIDNLKPFIINCYKNNEKLEKFKNNSRKASFNFSKNNANKIFNEIEKK